MKDSKILGALKEASGRIDEVVSGLEKGRSLEEFKEALWSSYELCEYGTGLLKLKIPESQGDQGRKTPPQAKDIELLVYAQDRIDEVVKGGLARGLEKALQRVREARDALKVIAVKTRG